MANLSSTVVWLKLSKALDAALTALSTSAELPIAICPITSSLEGFKTSNMFFPSTGSTHSPFI